MVRRQQRDRLALLVASGRAADAEVRDVVHAHLDDVAYGEAIRDVSRHGHPARVRLVDDGSDGWTVEQRIELHLLEPRGLVPAHRRATFGGVGSGDMSERTRSGTVDQSR